MLSDFFEQAINFFESAARFLSGISEWLRNMDEKGLDNFALMMVLGICVLFRKRKPVGENSAS